MDALTPFHPRVRIAKDYPVFSHIRLVEDEVVPLTARTPLTHVGRVIVLLNATDHKRRSRSPREKVWIFTYHPALDLLRVWAPDGVEVNNAHKYGEIINFIRQHYPYRKTWA